MAWRDAREQIAAGQRAMGPLRFWIWMIACILLGLAWAGLGTWLMLGARWSDSCDHSGRKFIGLIKKLYCSPDLLSGQGVEIGLFVWLWSLPAFIIGFILYARMKKRRSNPISSQNSTE